MVCFQGQKLSMSFMVLLLLLSRIQEGMGDVVLSEKIMSLSLDSVILSAEAYSWRPWARGFAPIQNYVEEPDQAVLTEKDGYCFVAFRGTVYSVADWSENLRLGKKAVCSIGGDDGDHDDCCDVRSGFYDAYFTTYYQELEENLLRCVTKCKDKDECLVISGHSQGGAIAAVAGIRYSEYNPYVITFGEPPSVDPNCHLITSDRWYRYVNTKVTSDDIEYDPVPFAPGFGSMVYGQFIILGADDKDVAYFGVDSTEKFTDLNLDVVPVSPGALSNVNPKMLAKIKDLMDNDHIKQLIVNGRFQELMEEPHIQELLAENRMEEIWTIAQSYSIYSYAHALVGTRDYPGYKERIVSLIDNASSYPIPSRGFKTPDVCHYDNECETQSCVEVEPGISKCTGVECTDSSECSSSNHRCELGLCIPKFGSCMTCRNDSDCASGKCLESKCANHNAKMDNECSCQQNSDCESGRCEDSICEAKLAIHQTCAAHSDCLSDHCNWLYRCSSSSSFYQRKRRDSVKIKVKMSTFDIILGITIIVLATYCGFKAWKNQQRTNGYRQVESIPMVV